jgi:hypothetical protein
MIYEFQINNIKGRNVILAISLSAALLLLAYSNNVSLIKAAYSTADNKKEGISSMLDKDGIPIVDYGYQEGIYIGPQSNPITVAHTALDYYNKYNRTGDDDFKQVFLNNSNWLVDNAVPHGNYSILEYKFPWPHYDVEPPWSSGMAQGQASDVLSKAHEITGQNKYLDSAKMLLNSFLLKLRMEELPIKHQKMDGGMKNMPAMEVRSQEF